MMMRRWADGRCASRLAFADCGCSRGGRIQLSGKGAGETLIYAGDGPFGKGSSWRKERVPWMVRAGRKRDIGDDGPDGCNRSVERTIGAVWSISAAAGARKAASGCREKAIGGGKIKSPQRWKKRRARAPYLRRVGKRAYAPILRRYGILHRKKRAKSPPGMKRAAWRCRWKKEEPHAC